MRIVIALVIGLTGGIAAEPPLAALQNDVRRIIDAVEPTVAAIIVSSNFAYPPLTAAEKSKPGVLGDYRSAGRRSDGIVPVERDKLDLADARNAADNTFGSGLVLNREGLVLTNYHLIGDARKIYIRYSDGKGSYADIHAADARSDLAVLRPIDGMPGRKPVKFADVRLIDGIEEKATVFRGQFIIALGHPFAAGDGKASASWGMISNVRRRAPNPAGTELRQSYLHHYSNLIQTDARLNLGCSGGALVNLDGEVIGLLSAAAAVAGSEASGGYVLPMDPIYRRIINVLKEGREIEYGFLGITPAGYTKDGPRTGLHIGRVSGNSPASAAKLLDGDILQSVDGRPVREQEDLYLLISGSLAGTEVTLGVQRGGDKLTRKATLAKFANNFPSIASVRPDAVFGLRVDYSSLATQPVFFDKDPLDTRSGVTIRELEPGSPAAEKLQPLLGGKAMLITSVNDQPIKTPAEFYRAAKGAKSVKLSIGPANDTLDRERMVTLP